MDISSKHLRMIFQRKLKASVLAIIFTLMLASQLAPLCQPTANNTPATTVECSGDCNICGCSPESRAANTCCCSKKRQLQAQLHEDREEDTPDCCKQKPVKKKTILACGCPCRNGQQIALSDGENSEVLPYHFREQFNITDAVTIFTDHTPRLTSRQSAPPDPPPRHA